MSHPSIALRRRPERALTVPEGAEPVLASALVAHVGTVVDGWPRVIPLTFLYEDGRIYLHGSPASGTIRLLASGAPACVEVTLVDGRVASKTAEKHSVNYRSVVCYGRGRLVQDDAVRVPLFERLIVRYFPGRVQGVDYQPPTAKEMKAVALIAFEIEAMSAKARAGGPMGDGDDDPSLPGSAALLPVDRWEV